MTKALTCADECFLLFRRQGAKTIERFKQYAASPGDVVDALYGRRGRYARVNHYLCCSCSLMPNLRRDHEIPHPRLRSPAVSAP